MSEATWQQFPLGIVDHRASGWLELQWQDGSRSRLPHALLRARCRCAECQQRWRERGAYPDIDASVRLAQILPISDRGLNLVFSDGHGRGIYPWPYLHELTELAPLDAAA